MHKELILPTPSLAGGTELLVMAPLKPGFVPTLDSITYKSRAKAVLRLLHAARLGQHEYRLLRALSDAVERVGVIHTLRVAVVDGDNPGGGHVLLSVNFDGAYEAYVRTIWQKSPRLLDLIFCNTDGHRTGWEHSLDTWNGWLRSVMVETPFFYAPPGVTRQDLSYLRMLEERDRGRPAAELERTRIVTPIAEEITWSRARDLHDPSAAPGAPPASSARPTREAIRQSLQGLGGIYRLADLYRPGTADGLVLQRAAQELLPELQDLLRLDPREGLSQMIDDAAGRPLARALAWFRRGLAEPLPPPRMPDALSERPAVPVDQVQCGVLREIAGITNGVMGLVALPTPAAAAAFLQTVQADHDGPEADPDHPQQPAADAPVVNLAFTAEGLRACGLAEAELEWFPLEFRQGMAARAGLLGDVRGNHPRRWALPRANGDTALDTPLAEDSAMAPLVPTEAVHVVLQLRVAASAATRQTGDGARGLLANHLKQLLEPAKQAGAKLLSVQWMDRAADGKGHDHFGFPDGLSQPRLTTTDTPETPRFPNQARLGEVLAGHANEADRETDLPEQHDPARRALLRNGSFLVVRKLRQHVHRLDAVVQAYVDTADPPITPHEVLGKMMGRYPGDAPGGLAGRPLVAHGAHPNDFNYLDDADGARCPLGAHIRRANPRTLPGSLPPTLPPGARVPHLMRRSLPYGPPRAADEDQGPGEEPDRGLVFMAYNASIAEQFEVMQRWLSGGNSARNFSGGGCPFLGVPEAGRRRHFRFEHAGLSRHLPLDGSDDLGVEPEALVTLQWGLYAFAPSAAAAAVLRLRAAAAATAAQVPVPWSADRGRAEIQQLQQLEAAVGTEAAAMAWKEALEDPESISDWRSASIWAAVREYTGGALRTPFGVLVAAPALVQQVLENSAGHYTAAGYQQRLRNSIGPIFLGMDASDPDYKRLSTACNDAIAELTFADGFDQARSASCKVLFHLVDHAQKVSDPTSEHRWELTVDLSQFVAAVLAMLCDSWFGLRSNESGGPFTAGVLDWSWQPGDAMFCPGHFTATSRATFQPSPTGEVQALSMLHGQHLTQAMLQLLQSIQETTQAPVTRAVLTSLWGPTPGAQLDAARTLTGALMGFLPTTDGVLRRLLGEWTRDGRLLALAARVDPTGVRDFTAAQNLFGDEMRRTMMLKPVPEQIWRLAAADHELPLGIDGRLAVRAGDKLVLGLVSATQARLEQAGASADVFPVFGGNRKQTGAPTHACPGYHVSIGVIAGVISALVDPVNPANPAARPKMTMRPGPGAGVVFYDGPLRAPPTAPPASAPPARTSAVARPDKVEARGELLGFGDSWLLNPFAPGMRSWHLAGALAALGYDTTAFSQRDSCAPARPLAALHAVPPEASNSLYGLLRDRVAAHLQTGRPLPRAVLVSGGGNDVKDGAVGSPFDGCRRQGQDSPLDGFLHDFSASTPVDLQGLTHFLDSMESMMRAVAQRLADAGRDPANQKPLVPVLLHAYDYPYPDGRSGSTLLCSPLAPIFTRKGYPAPTTGHPPDRGATAVMRQLITDLNDRYERVAKALQTQGLPVHFVRLAGTLQAAPDFAGQPLSYQAYWANELHPTRRGFELLAQALDTQLTKLLVPSA